MVAILKEHFEVMGECFLCGKKTRGYFGKYALLVKGKMYPFCQKCGKDLEQHIKMVSKFRREK